MVFLLPIYVPVVVGLLPQLLEFESLTIIIIIGLFTVFYHTTIFVFFRNIGEGGVVRNFLFPTRAGQSAGLPRTRNCRKQVRDK